MQLLRLLAGIFVVGVGVFLAVGIIVSLSWWVSDWGSAITERCSSFIASVVFSSKVIEVAASGFCM